MKHRLTLVSVLAGIAGDKIVFNTESCELEIITTSGKAVWKKWLGDGCEPRTGRLGPFRLRSLR